MSMDSRNGGASSPSSAPRWTRSLLRRMAASAERADEAIGDLEEVHWNRLRGRGWLVANLLTALEALDMAVALLRERRDLRANGTTGESGGQWRIPTASRLDFTLGLRMLARYPSLTAVAVLAMAFGIATGAGAFHLVKELMLLPPLPYSEEARIVRIQNVSTATTFEDPRALHDFTMWRTELRSVEHLSVLQLRDRNLTVAEAAGTPVAEAAVSTTAFNLLRITPLFGRPLVAADEAPGAPAVAVIGHDLWQRRFDADRNVIGRTVRLGGELTTIVGVMPKDFMFFVPREGFTTPPAQDLWVPFRASPTGYARGEGPPVTIFGRLAPGASHDRLQAELTTLAARTAAIESLDAGEQLRPRIITFDRPLISTEGPAASGIIALSALFLVALMVVVCGNVALLLFARAATREGEIAVRTALGASRGRIVVQLFAEALVIAGLAIVVGLLGASAGIRWTIGVLRSVFEAQGVAVPTWIGHDLDPGTIAYAVALAVVGAVVAGVLPGLKVTGKRGGSNLQRLVGRGASTRMGGVWTAVIVTQVALTVMLVPIAGVLGLQTREMQAADHGLPAPEYLTARLEMDGDAGAVAQGAGSVQAAGPRGESETEFRARFDREVRALERRLIAEPGVTAVTVGTQLPGSWHSNGAFEVQGMASEIVETGSATYAQIASVDPDFFDVMRVPVVAGRGFADADVGIDQRVAIVNESFVQEALRGRNAVGQRVRRWNVPGSGKEAEWYTIVGVVRDLAMTIDPTLPHNAGIYYPLEPGAAYPLRMAVRVAGDPGAFTGRLHEISSEATPTLRLSRPLPLHQAAQANLIAYDSWFRVIVVAGLMALLLTNAGIYAIISFTVARRTREIGVRVALGADRGQVISAILARTARHVGIGVVVGAVVGGVGTVAMSEGGLQLSAVEGGGMLVGYMVVMMAVCLLACVVPTRRALRIQPTEALAAEG